MDVNGSKLSCIDMFSGTGGISLALRDFVTTIQYCELNEYCQSVLVDRMREGLLDKAPIHGNIRSLYMSPHTQPLMISGGSPCTDISTMGLKKGIVEGLQSNMFFEMMRIADECPSVKVLFLENVSNIVKLGMADVVEALTSRGFDMYWTVRSAGNVGAPHCRKRWFCLGVRGDPAELRAVDTSVPAVKEAWPAEPTARVTFRDGADWDPNWVYRCRCLGNAVVPSVVRAAFVELVRLWKKAPALQELLVDFSSPLEDLTYPYPTVGAIIGREFFAVPMKQLAGVQHAVTIRVDGREFANYPTPRHGLNHASTVTERSLHDLPTVLINSDVAKEQVMAKLGEVPENLHKHVLPNVEYIEWMMGYAPGWTKSTLLPSLRRDSRRVEEEGGGEEAGHPREAREPRKFKPNGMHMMMKDHPGLGFNKVAQLWNPLTADEKAAYSKRAAEAYAAEVALEEVTEEA
jgi:DNA (cytosine-5)-methyltransferase 1